MTVNRSNYINNDVTKNRSVIPLVLNIMPGPYKFKLWVIVDHSVNCGHYTASINCCRETFYCNDTRITKSNINDIHNPSPAYILLYKLVVECLWPDRGGWILIQSHGAGTVVCPLHTGRGTGNEACGWGRVVCLWWPVLSGHWLSHTKCWK